MKVDSFHKDGYLYVPYPKELRDAVENAMQSWIAFCKLPNEQKLKFGYDPDSKLSGNGYELKLQEGNRLDKKEDFHLRVAMKEDLLKRAKLVDEGITPRFVEDALAINDLMAPLVFEFAQGIENTYNIPGFRKDVEERQPMWLLRFLHYFGDRDPGEEIATGHVDKGGFTLHLYESHEGVERLTYDTKEWKPLPLSHEETVIIPGMRLQNRSKGKLRALCHRVVATEETAKEGRYSAVCFFNFNNGRFYDKDTHGRLQNWTPGVFYDMPFEDFDKLFID